MIDKLIKMDEDRLSKTVLLPLFEKIYGCRVAFTGGKYEKGRDLIIYRKDPIGNNEFIGVQVKKIEGTPNTSQKSFQQLINQLEQLSKEPVICPDTGSEILLKSRMFITPYEIPEKSYDTHKGAFYSLIQQGVNIIDGKRLLVLIEKHHEGLIRIISGDESYIGEKIRPKLSNDSLMDALHFSSQKKELCKIYCETSLKLGNSKESRTMSYFKCVSESIDIKGEEIHDAKILNTLSNRNLGFYFYNENELSIADSDLAEQKKISEKIDSKSSYILSARSSISNLVSNSSFSKVFPHSSSSEFDDFIFFEYRHVKLSNEDFKNFNNEVSKIKEILEKIEPVRNEIKELRYKKDEKAENYKISIHSKLICKRLESSIDLLLEMERNGDINVKNYLANSQTIDICYKIIKNNESAFKKVDLKIERTPAKISIKEAFHSGKNIIILGEAGSGKTTNLQIHAIDLYNNYPNKLTIYMTLSELAVYMDKNSEANVIDGISFFMNKLGIDHFSFQSLSEHFKNSETCLILDSIDEAIVRYPWILNSIRNFSSIFTKCQIITSSRFTVKDLPSLGFVNISLLPFSKASKEEFFCKWFSEDNNIVKELIEHLDKNPELDNVITNPLSATIMATLKESGVQLPTSEATLYKKRFELLSGVFDKFKGINRMLSSPDLIMSSCRHLAYVMHSKNLREIEEDSLLKVLSKHVGNNELAKRVFSELVSPCEIILINPNGKYGFGHLRFQEYLVSEHLVNLRNVKFDKLLLSPWWNDVFLLYSQHAYEIEWLVNYVTANGLTYRVHELIRKMINYRVIEDERCKLHKRLEISLRAEMASNDSYL